MLKSIYFYIFDFRWCMTYAHTHARARTRERARTHASAHARTHAHTVDSEMDKPIGICEILLICLKYYWCQWDSTCDVISYSEYLYLNFVKSCFLFITCLLIWEKWIEMFVFLDEFWTAILSTELKISAQNFILYSCYYTAYILEKKIESYFPIFFMSRVAWHNNCESNTSDKDVENFHVYGPIKFKIIHLLYKVLFWKLYRKIYFSHKVHSKQYQDRLSWASNIDFF